MKRPQLTVEAVILCEEVRRELSGKDILLGVFSGGIAVVSFPSVARVALWFQLKAPELGTYPLEITILGSRNETLGSFSLELTASSTSDTAAFFTPTLALSVEAAGVYKVQIRQGAGPNRVVKRFSLSLMDEEMRFRLLGKTALSGEDQPPST